MNTHKIAGIPLTTPDGSICSWRLTTMLGLPSQISIRTSNREAPTNSCETQSPVTAASA